MAGEFREEPLDRREVWEYMWKNDPDGGCTNAVKYVKLLSTKKWPVLEVGCGSALRLELPKNGNWYVGSDVALDPLKIALKRHPSADFVQADGAYLPFREGVFEKTFSFFAVGLMGAYGKYAAAELVRVAKRGAKVSFSVSHSDPLVAEGIEFMQIEKGKLFLLNSPVYLSGLLAMDNVEMEKMLLEVGAKNNGSTIRMKKNEEGIEIADLIIVRALKR